MQTAEPKSIGSSLSGLKSKLIRVMIIVGALPLILAMVIAYIQGHKSLEGVIGASFKALSYETSTKIDFYLKEEIAKNLRLAMHPTLVLFVEEQNRLLDGFSEAEINSFLVHHGMEWDVLRQKHSQANESAADRILLSFLKGSSSSTMATRAMFVTDARGALIASINSVPDYYYPNYSIEKFPFQENVSPGFIGGLTLDPRLDEYVFHMAFPLIRHDKKIGMFHRIYSAKEYFSASIEPVLFGDTGHVMLINSAGVVIDCPILPTGFQLSNPELVKSVTGEEPGWAQTQGNGHGSQEVSIIGYSPLMVSNKIIKASSGEEWFTFAWQASDELFAPTENLFVWISAAGFLSLLLIAAMGSIAADKVVKPIKVLQSAAARIGRGEMVDTLHIKTGDEIEMLANEINSMNRMLRQSFSGLENQVREKSLEVIQMKEYTESILMSVPDVVMILNQFHAIEYVNISFERLLNLSGKEVIGKLLAQVDPKNEQAWNVLSHSLERYVRLSTSPGNARKEPEGYFDYVAKDPLVQRDGKQSSEGEAVIKLGDRFFAYQFFDVSILGPGNHRIGVIMKEVTEQKNLQDQLALAEKLSGLGTLAAGIAHEMNNPLYSIMGYTEAILDEEDPKTVKSYATKVLERAKHMASIILNLSGYSRSGVADKAKPVDINERLEGALDIAILATYSDDIELVKDCEKTPMVNAKPEEIQQVFVNIIRNAVQAMDGKGRLTIRTRELNNQVVVTIQDTGPGIPQEFLSKVFDPFFTTKEQGKGTGLGLNIVHKIVEKYGGKIEIESPAGGGATFVISFPAAP